MSNLTAQDKLLINLNSGINTTYYLRGQVRFLPDDSYLWGFVKYSGDVNFANSLGVTYETKTFNILEETMYFATQSSLSYRGGVFNGVQKNILISNDIYLPKRVKNKQLRWFLGVRNSFVIFDSLIDEFSRFTFYRYQLGLTTLLDYQINEKWYLGINAYASTRKLGMNDLDARIHTVEALLKISYNIK